MGRGFRIDGDYPDLMAVPKEIRRKALPRIVKAGQALARQKAPKRRGLSSGKSLVSRIRGFVEKATGEVGHIKSFAPHSHLIEFGTAAHSLRGGSGKSKRKRGRVMLVYGDPGIIRAGGQHRGSAANPFMERTEEALPLIVDKELLAVGEAALANCIRDARSVFGGLT